MEEMIQKICTWLTTGKIDPAILADNFMFSSPYWEGNNKAEFLAKFEDPTQYINVSLSNIIKFDPIIPFKSLDGKYFAIIMQYQSKNCTRVYETVFGKVNDQGLLVELRSIYDLAATEKAHNIN